MSEPQKVEVTVKKDKDDETKKDEVERLKAELEAERLEKEDLESKLSLMAKKKFEEKKAKLGCKDDDVTSPEQLKAWASGAGKKSKEYLDPTSRTSSGVLTLQGQTDTSFLKKKYEGDSQGFKEMLDELHERARDSDNPEDAAQAQVILDEMLLKTVKGVKEGKKTSGDVPMKLDMKKYNKERSEKRNE